jgi:hypothetical protein
MQASEANDHSECPPKYSICSGLVTYDTASNPSQSDSTTSLRMRQPCGDIVNARIRSMRMAQYETLSGCIRTCRRNRASRRPAVTNFAGTGVAGYSGDGTAAVQAQLNNPFGLVRGPDGALWFADYAASVVRRIGTNGVIATVVGNGKPGDVLDSDPLKTQLARPHGIWVDTDGGIFISDTENHRILYIAAAGPVRPTRK